MNAPFQNTELFAKTLDEQDVLRSFRDQFYFPKHGAQSAIYFVGNSLGLQPKSTRLSIEQELNDWANFAVEGHFMAKNPWYSYHESLAKPISNLLGSRELEVVSMNSLSVNLHLLLATFYQPTSTRYKIVCEAKAFPSDQYIIESQIAFHNQSLSEAIIEIKTPGQEHINEEDILEAIETHKDSIAVVLIGAVNYYTGQVFDLQKITQAAHKYGILVGFDLAHAIGNIELNLHKWEVDFASWCTYKYLNSGPGGVSGIYIHEKHATNTSLKRLAGWWGYDKSTRFKMEQGFVPIPTAEGWQLSNAPILSMAALKASLEIFEQAGFQNLRKKSVQLTAYLEFVLEEVKKENKQIAFEIITPPGKQRGSQLSVVFSKDGKKVFDYLFKNGVMTDWREPDVIRMAPVALYNSFTDIYRFGQVLKNYS